MAWIITLLLFIGISFAQDDVIIDTTFTAESLENQASDLNAGAGDQEVYSPFSQTAYLTSSFGENRGTRYHMGIDYSTNMEEGWPVFAPEDGRVKEIKVSPYGYGKVMYYQGKSGKTWVFAHQASFGKLDEIISQKQYASQRNDVSVQPGTTYKKGDTLTFAGSTGIGNPHLHLEIRLDGDRNISPCGNGVLCPDTIAPQILEVAVWQGNEIAFTNRNAFENGCVVTPVKNEFNLSMAVKIVDYAREPKDNPMSIRRIELFRYGEKIYSKIQDTLRQSTALKIRDELLWAEEADTAGDWHYIDAKIGPLSTYILEVEDYAGHVTQRNFTFHPKCKNNKPITHVKKQTSPLYTILSKAMVDLFRCNSGYKFSALNEKNETIVEDMCATFPKQAMLVSKVLQTKPDIRFIKYNASAEITGTGKAEDNIIAVYPKKQYQGTLNWNLTLGDASITQRISGIPVAKDTSIGAIAVIRTHTDSLDYFEFHPKGMQFKGKWDVCIDKKTANAPLYWLGETTRDWFYFSKQTAGAKRCASANELRDIAWVDDKEAPTLGFAYWTTTMIGGVHQPALKIPVLYQYAGIADGNSITARDNKGKWIAVEYDSEPRELILAGERLPEAGQTIKITIVDEAKNKITHEVTIPEL